MRIYRSNGERIGNGVYEFGQGTINLERDLAQGGLYYLVVSESKVR